MDYAANATDAVTTAAITLAPALSPVAMVAFPEQLHNVLTKLELERQTSVASWMPHGRSFAVHNREKFCQQILPFWFRQTKFTSFQRQLSMYGFVRISSGPDKGSYYHVDFVWGQPLRARYMKRTPVKGRGPRRASVPSHDPNFYLEPPLSASNSARVAQFLGKDSFLQHYRIALLQEHWRQNQPRDGSVPDADAPIATTTTPLIHSQALPTAALQHQCHDSNISSLVDNGSSGGSTTPIEYAVAKSLSQSELLSCLGLLRLQNP